jgi:hypothetical protein
MPVTTIVISIAIATDVQRQFHNATELAKILSASQQLIAGQ